MPANWSGWPEPVPVLIAASSGRALAASARRAGHRIAVLDLFCDTDLAALTGACAKVSRASAGGFDEDSLLEAALRLAPPNDSPEWAFVYGAGFEARPQLIDRMAAGRTLLGNTGAVVAAAKDPVRLNAALDRLGLPYPETRLDPPRDRDGPWLVKQVGGAGGIHIRYARPDEAEGERRYYQRFVEGRAVSAQVLGTKDGVTCLGFSEQWPGPGSLAAPFRFGGAVAPAELSGALARKLEDAGCRLADLLGLVGLNSVDFIVDDGAEAFHVIEVNPRPGATLELFERAFGASLFALHLRAAGGETLEPPALPAATAAHASAILYADEAFAFPDGFVWPEWTADRPAGATRIGQGEPVCTVFAQAHIPPGASADPGGRAARARELALARSEALRDDVRRCIQSRT
ncbi:MAG: ATP-grasp domain-containing protein [Alphaproteobacteria bacterium]